VGERERQDPMLDVRRELVRHPRPTTLAWPEGLESPGEDLASPPVERGRVHAHDPARLAHVAELTGEGEQSHPMPMDDIIERQAVPPLARLAGRTKDAPLVSCGVGGLPEVSGELGVSSA
jgi:hypothetical protein